MMYLKGKGTQPNGELAVKYLQLAVDRKVKVNTLNKYLQEAKKLMKKQQAAKTAEPTAGN